MIKGVNRNVIEIVDTNSDLFERAILFVRPAGWEQDPAQLESCAHNFLARAKLGRRILKGRGLPFAVLKYFLATALGADVAALLLVYL